MTRPTKLNIKSALDDFKSILDVLKNIPDDGKGKAAKSFRTRARNGPSNIISNGLSSTLLFFISKAGHDVYKDVAKAIESREGLKKGNEKFGYAAYMYLILKRLKERGLLKTDIHSNPLDAIKELVEMEDYAYLLIRDYLIEIRKLASACITESGRIKC